MEKKDEFLKNIKKGKKNLIIGLILIVCSIVGAVAVYFIHKEDESNIKELSSVKTSGVYAKVDVNLMTNYFATNDYSGIEHKTYFVWDDKYIYVADLSPKVRKSLDAIYNYSYKEEKTDEDKVVPVTIKGYTKTIPSDLKKIAIDAYNTLFKEEFLNTKNFSDYLGVVYLDTYESAITNILSDLLLSIPWLIIGLIFIAIYIKNKIVTKKSIKKLEDKWEKLLKEMDNSDTFYFKKGKMYLTRNFLVDFKNGLVVYDYKDIVWIYPHEYRYNGNLSQKSIFVITKDSKAHKIATVSASKKNLSLIDEAYDTLMNRIPNVLCGFTKENKEKAKELYEK